MTNSFDIRNSAFEISPRPYQVYAVKHMVTCIDDDNGNGYIWHTTGSGKTPTSFKAATLTKLRDTLLPKLLSMELSLSH
jgi:type I site-specific restriction-modification system R (restriction) subunit